MAENYDGEVDENELHELYVEVADSNGGIAGLGSYVMVSPSMKAQDLKKELEGYLGIEASKQKIWLCLPDDFPPSSVLGFPDPVLQLREDNPDGSSSSISRPHSPRNTSRSTSDSTSLLSSAGSVDRSSRAAPAALMGPAPSAPGSSS